MSYWNIALVLLSSLFHAYWNILTQASRNSLYFSGLKGVFIMLVGALFLPLSGYGFFSDEILLWAAASGILHGTYMLSLSRAYNTQDLSYVYPIARSAPVFVPPLAWLLLDETPKPFTLLAVAIIFTAIYLLHFEGHLIRGFAKLMDAILHKDLRWSFITLAIVVAYSLVDKRGMDVFIKTYPDRPYTNGLVFLLLESWIGFILCLIYLFLYNPCRNILTSWKIEYKEAFSAAVATIGSYGLICVVLQFDSVSAVVSLRQTSVLMVTVWGCFKLKEPFGKQRLISATLILIGVALMGLR